VRIKEGETSLVTPTGPMRTVVFAPEGEGRYPGVVMYSEIFQITGPIRRAAAFLAGCGHVVAVPEIYHDLVPAGTVLAYDKAGAERGNACKVARPVTAYDADARAALDHLATLPTCTGRLGSVGFCVGGHLALRAALEPDVRAAACFEATDIHSGNLGMGGDDTLARIGDVRGELLMAWGRQDPHVPLEGRRLIHDALESGSVSFTWHELNAAHAAVRDEESSGRYDPLVARLFWELTLDLFRRRLTE
jgi:carboxymethylenebutenolidase